LRLTLLLVLFLPALGLASPLSAATISPDSDSNAMFAVMAEPHWLAGADPRADRHTAVQTSYFEYRESTRPAMPETPFAPKMPRVENDPGLGLTKEESLRLAARR
jgi:hypothetical protein